MLLRLYSNLAGKTARYGISPLLIVGSLVACDDEASLSTLVKNGAFEPQALDFGVLPLGTSKTLPVRLENTERAALTIDRIDVSEGFQLRERTPALQGRTILAGDGEDLEVSFQPTNEAIVNGRLLISSGDLEIMLPLRGEGSASPPVTCSPAQLTFGDVSRGQTKTEMLTCETLGDQARFVSAEISGSTMFRLADPLLNIDAPSGASAEVSVTFQSDGLPSSQKGTLTIHYENTAGPGSFTVPLGAEVVPPAPTDTDISLVLSWPTPSTDLDLHFVAPGGSFLDPYLDCSYLNLNPDWGEPGVTDDNPFLDRDDTDGFGPENINLMNAVPGTYEVYVHYYSNLGQGPSDATIEVYVGGERVHTGQMDQLECKELWHVGTIEWLGTMGTFTARDTRVLAEQGICF